MFENNFFLGYCLNSKFNIDRISYILNHIYEIQVQIPNVPIVTYFRVFYSHGYPINTS